MVYVSSIAGRGVFAIAHAQGHMTLLPQTVSLPGASQQTAPLVAVKRHQLMIGGKNVVHVLNLDQQGRLTGETANLRVANDTVRALAYSELHGRVYVPVEEAP